MPQTVLFAVAVIAVLGFSAQWLAWRLGIPSILLLLLAGLLAGPIAGFLDPDELLGPLLLPAVSLAVALILYEGGLTLRLSDLPKVGRAVRNLVSVGALVTWAVSAAGAYLLFDLDLRLAILLGAVLVVTGPTVIGPLLQNIRPTGNSAAILRWEGIVIDPIGALLAVLVFEVITVAKVSDATAYVVVGVFKTVVFGGGLGLAAAILLAVMLHRYWVPDFLQNAVSLMFVVAVFTAANSIQHESGLLAATVMGIALANQRWADVRHIVEFKENLRVLLISALFILLAARLQPAELTAILGLGIAYVVLLVVVARPLSVLVATLRGGLTRADRIFLAALAPRGIVAAAVSSVFALRLEALGLENASRIVPITFMVIIGTVALYGVAAPIVARRLGVADSNPQGVLFVGAQAWVRAVAGVLKDKGVRVFLVDTNRDNTTAARMAGLPTYTGSVLADRALDEMDLGGIGRLLAVTPNEWVNVLAVQRFTRIFGRNECYQLVPLRERGGRKPLHKHLQGRPLFGAEIDYLTLARRFSGGAVAKATPLSDSFHFDAFRARYGETAALMFLLSDEGWLSVLSADGEREPQAGDTLIGLVRDIPAARKPEAHRRSSRPAEEP